MTELWEFPIDDFLVLARPDIPGLYILSPSARTIWDLRKNNEPLPELVRNFAATYDIPLELAAEDVARTLDEWATGLLGERLNPLSSADAGEVQASINDPFFSGDFLVLGKKIRIILQTSELAEEIVPRLEALPQAASTPDFTFSVLEDAVGFRIFRNERYVANGENIGAARGILLQEIVRSCRDLDCLAVFHAGACGSNSGCVVFPGATQSGKTTLAAVLMNMGWTFYSDDSVLLERDTFSVPAMPFALTVREGSWAVLSSRFPELQDNPIVSRYGQRVRFLAPDARNAGGQCAPVSAIVFVRFAPTSTKISTLSTLQTLLRLQESGFWVAHDEQSIRAFLKWLQITPAFSMNYSDVDQAASLIGRLL